MTLLDEARRIADEVLFPAVADVDRASLVPVEQPELLPRRRCWTGAPGWAETG